ncbi:hypothetical protein V6Z11_D12G034400, partial [Gossypium hirsutum]
HHLKLYPEDESGPMSTKKPVVVESYDEIVFTEPPESFLARVTLPPPDEGKKKRGDTKDHPLSPWFLNFSSASKQAWFLLPRMSFMFVKCEM